MADKSAEKLVPLVEKLPTPLDLDALHELARIRASGDLKNLKRVIRDFYRLLTPTLNGEELQAAHENFWLGLDQLTLQLSKTERLRKVTDIEVLGYESEVNVIEEAHYQTQQKIASLQAKLETALRDRERAIEYDGIGRAVERLPNRDEGQETINKLNADIALLREEQKTYKVTWTTRQDGFAEIVDRLTVMSEAIAEEKNEQERRRALEDADDEDPLLLPHASTSTGANTPIPSSSKPLPGLSALGSTLDPNAEPFEMMEGIEVEGDGEGGRNGEGEGELEEGEERGEKEDLERGERGNNGDGEEKEEGEMELT